jgi:hypothetical protein
MLAEKAFCLAQCSPILSLYFSQPLYLLNLILLLITIFYNNIRDLLYTPQKLLGTPYATLPGTMYS